MPQRMRIRANLIANYAGQGWTALAQILFMPVYIHLLGIEAFALIGFYLMLQFWLALLDLGIIPTTAREMARFSSGMLSVEAIRDLLRSFELICLGLALSIVAAFAFAASYIATTWFNLDQLSPSVVSRVLALVGIVIALRLGESLYRSCLIGLQRQVWLNGALAGAATVRSVGAVFILLYVERSIDAYFLWQAGISLAMILLLRMKVLRVLPLPSRRPRFSSAAMRQVGRFATGMMVVNILGLVLLQLDKILISNLLPLGTYGLYMLASTLAGALYALITPITQAIYPALVEQVEAEDRQAELHIFRKASAFAAAVVAPPALALIFFAESILFAWSGDANLAAAAAPSTALLAIGTSLHCLTQLPFYLQLAHGWTSFTVKLNAISVLLLVPILVMTIPRFGITAAAGSWIALNIVYMLTIPPITLRKLMPQETLSWYASLGAGVAAPLAVAALASLIPISDEPRFVQGAFVAVVGGLILVASLLSLGTVRRWIGAIAKGIRSKAS